MRAMLFPMVLAISVFLTGCGADVPRGTVHGTIKYQGKPLGHGTLIFMGSDNMTYTADLQPDGTYTVSGVPRGTLKVAIQQSPARPTPRANPGAGKLKGGMSETKDGRRSDDGAAPEAKPIGPTIPATYANAETSGLNVTLAGADQEWNADLK